MGGLAAERERHIKFTLTQDFWVTDNQLRPSLKLVKELRKLAAISAVLEFNKAQWQKLILYWLKRIEEFSFRFHTNCPN